MARTIPEPNENDRLEANHILLTSNDEKIVAQLVAEVRWLRNLQHTVERPILYRIQYFNSEGNSWAYFESAYCCLQYVRLLNEHQCEFTLWNHSVMWREAKTASDLFVTIEELEKLASEEE